MDEVLTIRTKLPLGWLISSHSSGEWIISKKRLEQCEAVEIYNWDRTEVIRGVIDHARCVFSSLDNSRMVIRFAPATRKPEKLSKPKDWVSRNAIRYQLITEESDTIGDEINLDTEVIEQAVESEVEVSEKKLIASGNGRKAKVPARRTRR